MSLFGLKEKKEIERLKKLLTPEHYTLGDINQEIEAKRKILDELEKLVEEIAPTAEFKRTILAEQYRQSLSIDHLEDVVMVNDIDDLEDDLI